MVADYDRMAQFELATVLDATTTVAATQAGGPVAGARRVSTPAFQVSDSGMASRRAEPHAI
jgi:hypothetical protein